MVMGGNFWMVIDMLAYNMKQVMAILGTPSQRSSFHPRAQSFINQNNERLSEEKSRYINWGLLWLFQKSRSSGQLC